MADRARFLTQQGRLLVALSDRTGRTPLFSPR
jgi:hypothetical protein